MEVAEDRSNPNWKLGYQVEDVVMVIPEPSHRIAPAGVSSGVSVRSYPSASLGEITRICQFYEAKSGGHYTSDSPPTGRYVFDMSKEIQTQIQALESQAREKDARIASLTAAQTGWDSSFGPDSDIVREAEDLKLPFLAGALLTPAYVAEAIRTQARCIRDAESALSEQYKLRHEAEAAASHSRAAQAEASSTSMEEMRRTGRVIIGVATEEHDKALDKLREQQDLALKQIIQEKDAEFNKSLEAHKKQLNDVQLELLNNRQHMINSEAEWRKRVEDVEQRERAELRCTKEHFEALLQRSKCETTSALEELSSAMAAASGLTAGERAEGAAAAAASWGASVSMGESEKVRSLALLLEEAKKEVRWLRERSSESERVIEALRKTIMRQAELSSQREAAAGAGSGSRGSGGPHHHGGGGVSRYNGSGGSSFRGRQQHQQHHHQSHHQQQMHLPPPPPQHQPPLYEWHAPPPAHHHRDRGDDRQRGGSGAGLRMVPPRGQPQHQQHYMHEPEQLVQQGRSSPSPNDQPDRSWSRSAPLPDSLHRSNSAPSAELLHHQLAQQQQQQQQQNYMMPSQAPPPQQAQQQSWDRAPPREAPTVLNMQQYSPGMIAPPGGGYGSNELPSGYGASSQLPPPGSMPLGLLPPPGPTRSSSSPHLVLGGGMGGNLGTGMSSGGGVGDNRGVNVGGGGGPSGYIFSGSLFIKLFFLLN